MNRFPGPTCHHALLAVFYVAALDIELLIRQSEQLSFHLLRLYAGNFCNKSATERRKSLKTDLVENTLEGN